MIIQGMHYDKNCTCKSCKRVPMSNKEMNKEEKTIECDCGCVTFYEEGEKEVQCMGCPKTYKVEEKECKHEWKESQAKDQTYSRCTKCDAVNWIEKVSPLVEEKEEFLGTANRPMKVSKNTFIVEPAEPKEVKHKPSCRVAIFGENCECGAETEPKESWEGGETWLPHCKFCGQRIASKDHEIWNSALEAVRGEIEGMKKLTLQSGSQKYNLEIEKHNKILSAVLSRLTLLKKK